MDDIRGILKLLVLVAISIVITSLFWLTLEKGGKIAKMGQKKVVPIVATHPDDLPRAVPARTIYRQKGQEYPRHSLEQNPSTVYKWVDKHGVVTFSDHPMSPKAKRIEVKPVNTYRFSNSYEDSVSSSGLKHLRPERRVRPKTAVRPKRPISASDYEFFTSAYQKNSREVILSGRISNGPPCKKLYLSIQAASNKGDRTVGTTTVEDIDWGSRLFETIGRSYYNTHTAWPIWHITGIQASCRD